MSGSNRATSPSSMDHPIAYNFDIDHFINPFIPRSFIHVFPQPISWLLGHHTARHPPIGSVLIWTWAFIGAFLGILLVEVVFHLPALQSHGTPIIIASMGATAILEYNVIDSPLAQPRNVLIGQLTSSLIGVSITKLFHLTPHFPSLRFLAGALSVGLSSACMGVLKSVHPPAGATALLVATSEEIVELGWFLVPLVMLGSVLMLVVACVVNNIQRQFPLYWWTAADLARPRDSDIERTDTEGDETANELDVGDSGLELEKHHEAEIIISEGRIRVPAWVALDEEQMAMLEILRLQLRQGASRSVSSETERTRVQLREGNAKGDI